MPFGIAICHEGWRYPETVRWAATRGARLVFHPQLTGSDRTGISIDRWGNPDSPYYEKAMMMRGVENTIYFASVNYAMRYQDSATTVVGSEGDCLANVPYGQEQLLVHDLDLARATGLIARRFNPAFYPLAWAWLTTRHPAAWLTIKQEPVTLHGLLRPGHQGAGAMSPAPNSATNMLLGYPDDARLLLINADDLGMYQAINEAIVRAFKEGIVRSTSLMVPCPGASQAIQLLREIPDLRFGVHLSIIRDIDHYHWEPLTPKETVPSLLDADGNLYSTDRMSEMLDRATLDELEAEFRAQIEAVLAANLRPTHLDWHCLHSGGRADIFDMTLGLAKAYGVALRVASQPFIDQVQRQGLPTDDYDLLDSFGVSIEETNRPVTPKCCERCPWASPSGRCIQALAAQNHRSSIRTAGKYGERTSIF